MRLIVITFLLILHSGCSLRPSGGSSRSQAQHLISNLDGFAQIRPSFEASNKLYQLRDVAIPLLIERVSSLNYRDEREVSRIAGACAILGTNAYPVLTRVIRDASSRDFAKQSGSLLILQLTGTASFSPVIDFLMAQPNVRGNRFLKENLLHYVEVFPVESVLELLRLYRLTNKSPGVKELIELSFQETIQTADYLSLRPILDQLLADQDPFLVSAAVRYVRRCGSIAVPGV